MTTARTHLRLCIYCVLFVLAELGIFYSYRHHDARFHWFAHFFAGASVVLIVMSVVAWRRRAAVPYPLLWILFGHLFAMFPDVLFLLFSVVHQQWMDVFVWHISIHFVPGRNITNYVIFMASLALYLTTLRSRTVVPAATE